MGPHPVATARAEIGAEIARAGQPPLASAMMLGEIWARVRAAGRGELVDSDRLGPVRSRPELWELRWRLPGAGEYRMYHAEPGSRPAMVGLAFHRKETDGLDADEIKRRQQGWMDRAARRMTDGSDARWGHVGRRCDECIDLMSDRF